MHENEIIKQLQYLIEELRHENAHTPPSLKRDGRRRNNQNKGTKGTPGQKKGIKV